MVQFYYLKVVFYLHVMDLDISNKNNYPMPKILYKIHLLIN